MSEALLGDNWLHQQLDTDSTLATLAPAQLITVSGSGGTFTLTFLGQTTAPLAWNAPAVGGASVTAALEALSTVGLKQTLIRSDTPGTWLVVFLGSLTNTLSPISGNGAGLTGPGAGITIAPVARICIDTAPQLTPFPYILATNTDPGQDVMIISGIRVMTNTVWAVRGVIQGQAYPLALGQIADAIDARLHKQQGPIAGGGYTVASYRKQVFRLPEAQSGIQYKHLGGIYAINVQA